MTAAPSRPRLGGFEGAVGGAEREQMAKMRFAGRGADKGTVVDDHGEGAGKLVRDGHGEIVTAPGNEGDFDAATRASPTAARLASESCQRLSSRVPSKPGGGWRRIV